jgi:hypothetical protein
MIWETPDESGEVWKEAVVAYLYNFLELMIKKKKKKETWNLSEQPGNFLNVRQIVVDAPTHSSQPSILTLQWSAEILRK